MRKPRRPSPLAQTARSRAPCRRAHQFRRELPVEDAEGRDALRDWRQWVQDGRASVKGAVLYLMQPSLTVEEWTAAHVAKHRCGRTMIEHMRSDYDPLGHDLAG